MYSSRAVLGAAAALLLVPLCSLPGCCLADGADTPNSHGDPRKPAASIQVQSYRYDLYNALSVYSAARIFCNTLPGFGVLASITTADEWNTIKGLLPKAMVGTKGNFTWIGLTSHFVSSAYAFLDSSPTSYVDGFINTLQPAILGNNDGCNCGSVPTRQDALNVTWLPCDHAKQPFICKVQTSYFPSPPPGRRTLMITTIAGAR